MRGVGLASAFRTLTIIRLPGNECANAATTLYWFPVVGICLGFSSLYVGKLGLLSGSPMLAAALVTLFLAYITRAFHLDGLADMADAFGGGWDREQVLRIMKDPHVGSSGVVALISVLLAKFAALAAVLGHDAVEPLVFVPLFSRTLVVLQTVANPYARPEGGTAGQLTTHAKLRHALVATAWTGLFLFLYRNMPLSDLAWVAGAGLVLTFLVAWRGRRRIGGITGDLLGATVETSETAMFIALAMVMHLS